MGQIASFLNDKLVAREAELLVDETTSRLKERSMLLDKIMPLNTYDDDEFVAYITEQLAPAASLIAPGGLIPMSSYGTFRRAVGELATIALGYQFDEVAQKRMRKAMEEATYKRCAVQTMRDPLTGAVTKGTNEGLANMIYGTIAKLIRGTIDRLNYLSWQVLTTGQISYTDPRTRITLNIDFRKPGATYNHFPNALVATGNTADRTLNIWTDYANADGLTLLYNSMSTYRDTTGKSPEMIAMTLKCYNHLLQQTTTKEAARMMMAVPQVGAVSPDMLTGILRARLLPPIVIFDEKFQEEVFDGNSTDTSDANIRNVNFLNDNRYVFLNSGMGERGIGICEEGRLPEAQNKNLGGNSSILVQAKTDPNNPMLDFVTSKCVALPILLDSRQAFSQQIL